MLFRSAGNDLSKIPNYVLLIGDGSYDFKDYNDGNTNFVPTYQSANSFHPIWSYVTDDYFGLLDDEESDLVTDIIDVGIGRWPVTSASEAQHMVDKVKSYYAKESLGVWRTKMTFVGDDEDGNLHMSQSDGQAAKAYSYAPELSVEKIYFDAYPQVAGAGGNRYPEVASAIDDNVVNGTLLMNYVGHGGELGWGHERVLQVSQVNAWENLNNMPLFLTATCEFSRFDDPSRVSAGELVLLNQKGGGIGLLTTTRLVTSGDNNNLIHAFYDQGFSQLKNGISELGALTMYTKQFGPKTINTRNFTLLGDPGVKLAFPKYQIITTALPDTIRALSKVTVSGEIRSESGNLLSDFNGVVYPTVYDKSKNITTLNNDGVGEFNFELQKSVLFKGKASVNAGKFTYTFIVPKDIDYNFGTGRIGYYAENGEIDASGYTNSFIVGGFDENAARDDEGPEVQLYLNDESFVFGGMTNENPILIAKINDESGINTAGTGIGHDITYVLDDNTTESIVLNDYYESELDDYSRGEVRYNLIDLSPGLHKISVKAWDVHNNSGEGYLEFYVAESANLSIDHVLNYPNPFTTATGFYLEHSQPGESLSVLIQIFTASGKLVKILEYQTLVGESRIGPIEWDGKDDFGDNIANGVYVYKVTVANNDGQRVDKYEKLVLLK